MAINYEGLLNQAQGMYGNILSGYNSALASQQAQQQQIMGGYNQLQSNVLGGLAGQGQARSQEIADQYTARQGQATQNLVSRGLGNSTVQSAVSRGLAFDESKSQNQLTEAIAAQNAQYQSQLGLAGLGYQNTANMQNTALLGQQLGYSANWQQSLLGAAMPGLNMQEQSRLQRMNALFGQLGGGGISGGSYGGGGQGVIRQRNPNPGGQSMQGIINAENLRYANDPMIDLGGYGMGYGGGGYGTGSPYVLPAAQSTSAASLVSSLVGGAFGGGFTDLMGGAGAQAPAYGYDQGWGGNPFEGDTTSYVDF